MTSWICWTHCGTFWRTKDFLGPIKNGTGYCLDLFTQSISFHVNSSHLSKEWEIFIRTKYKISYTLILYKCHKSNFNKCINEKFRNFFLPALYLIMYLMKPWKNFEKIAILKIWELVYFWGVKTHFGKLPLKWCIFRHEKKKILTNIML